MPRAYSEMILSSKPVKRVWCLGRICGSNVLARSRGTSSSSWPNSPLTVLPEFGAFDDLRSALKARLKGLPRGL